MEIAFSDMDALEQAADFPVGLVGTIDEIMGHSTALQSFQMLLLTIFVMVALLLAAIGIRPDGLFGRAAHQEMGIVAVSNSGPLRS